MINVTVIRISEEGHNLTFNEPANVSDVFTKLDLDSKKYTMSIKGRTVGMDTQLLDGDTLVLGASKLSAANYDYIMVSFVSSGNGGYAPEPIKIPLNPQDDGNLTIKEVYKLKEAEINTAYFRGASAENYKISMNGANATFETKIKSNYAGEVFIVFSKPMSAAK